jgi:phage tail-like protein
MNAPGTRSVNNSDAFARPPYSGKFLFEVDGLQIGSFTEVDGLQAEVAVEDLEEGGQNQFVHRLPGRMTWPNITFKRGVTDSDNLFAWLQASAGDEFGRNGNKLERKSAAVTLVSDKGERLRAWELAAAFPVRWRGPSFAATSTELASEELEIAHHGFQSSKP